MAFYCDDKVLRGEQVLKGGNLEIYSGGITVVTGMSGQGKSTLIPVDEDKGLYLLESF